MKASFSLRLSAVMLIPIATFGWQVYEGSPQDSDWLLQQAFDQYRGAGSYGGWVFNQAHSGPAPRQDWSAYSPTRYDSYPYHRSGYGRYAYPYYDYGYRRYVYPNYGHGWRYLNPYINYTSRYGYSNFGRKYGPFTGLSLAY